MDEFYVADNLLSNAEACDGYTCDQLHCGNKSSFTHVFGMNTDSCMPGFLTCFIRTFSAMKGLFSDNVKVQTGAAVKDILRQYNIVGMHSDPPQQNQNPAKRQIQEVKATTNLVVDQTGAPPWTCLMCMVYIV